jgi:hypothetical protein
VKKIKVLTSSNYATLLKIFQPYIIDIVHNNENATLAFCTLEYGGIKYKMSVHENINQKTECDILVVDDVVVERFTKESCKNISYKKMIGLFTNGEAYQRTSPLELFLQNPNHILITSWISSDIEPSQEDIEFFSRDNVIESTFISFFTIITRPEHNFLSSLVGFRRKVKRDYDIGFYSRYGYKSWRDGFTDIIRKMNLKIKEVNNFKHYKTGQKIKYEDIDVSNYISMLIKGNVFVHYDYFADMFDCKFHLVYETSQEESTVFITEKTIKELLFGWPCFIVGSHTIRNYLKELGFFTFDMIDYNQEKLYEDTEETLEGQKKSFHIELIKLKKFLEDVNNRGMDTIIEENEPQFKNNSELFHHLINDENIHRTKLIQQILLDISLTKISL